MKRILKNQTLFTCKRRVAQTFVKQKHDVPSLKVQNHRALSPKNLRGESTHQNSKL